jgi:uncharacterized protein YjbI with pentapeptide repeats
MSLRQIFAAATKSLKRNFDNFMFRDKNAADIDKEVKDAVRWNRSLNHSHLSGLNLQDVAIEGSNCYNLLKMQDSDFSHACLRGTRFVFVDLTNCNFSGADLSGASFFGCRMNKANMEKAQLAGAKISDCDLTEAVLKEADMSEAKLFNCDLYRADLSDANEDKVSITSCRGDSHTNFSGWLQERVRYIKNLRLLLPTNTQLQNNQQLEQKIHCLNTIPQPAGVHSLTLADDTPSARRSSSWPSP